MKHLLILFTLLSFYFSSSQVGGDEPRISISLFQDAKLAVLNDNYGNSPFTTDARLEVMLEDKVVNSGSFLIGLTLQYADLSQFNFTRYGLQMGYNFRNEKLPFKLGYFDYALIGGLGSIMRNFPDDNQGYVSFELTNQFAIFLSKQISLNTKITMMQRGDLSEKYNDDSGSFRPWDWKPNVYVGLTFYIDTSKK